jgi:hypothetical protein
MREQAHRLANCWCGHGGAFHSGEESGEVACRQCGSRSRIEETEVPMLVTERRRFERFGIPQPIRTSMGSSPAYVVDASIAGIGVLHHQPAPPPGSACRLMFYSEFGPITLECQVVRSTADEAGKDEKTFQTGMRIVAADEESEARLRTLVFALAVPPRKRPDSH